MNTKFLTDDEFKRLLAERVPDPYDAGDKAIEAWKKAPEGKLISRTPNKRVFTAHVSSNGHDTCSIRLELIGFNPRQDGDESEPEVIHNALDYLLPPGKRLFPVVEGE